MTTRLVNVAWFICAIIMSHRASLLAQDEVIFRNSFSGDVVVLPVTLAGSTYPFVLDSGSTHHVFDSSLAIHLGMPIGQSTANTTSKAVAVKLFHVPPAKVANRLIQSKKGAVVCLDLSTIREVTGLDIQGILGIDFFVDQVIVIDAASSTVRMSPRNRTDANWEASIPLLIDQTGLPFVELEVRETRSRAFLLDTGASNELSLEAIDFDKLVDSNVIKPEANQCAANVVGFGNLVSGRLRTFELGHFRHLDLLVNRGPRHRIGLGYLQRYICEIDVTGKVIKLNKGPDFDVIHNSDMSGLGLVVRDRRIVVKHVLEYSPALAAGISDGDIVIAVNGNDMHGKDIANIRNVLRSKDGQPIELRLLSGLNVHTASFKLRRQPWEIQTGS